MDGSKEPRFACAKRSRFITLVHAAMKSFANFHLRDRHFCRFHHRKLHNDNKVLARNQRSHFATFLKPPEGRQGTTGDGMAASLQAPRI